jgi:hypothetical protein
VSYLLLVDSQLKELTFLQKRGLLAFLPYALFSLSHGSGTPFFLMYVGDSCFDRQPRSFVNDWQMADQFVYA